MIRIVKYFVRHPLALMMTSGLLTLCAMGAVLLIYPNWVDSSLLEKLSSNNAMVRSDAIMTSATRAKHRPEMKRKLIDALDTTEDDTHFFAIVSALNTAGMFRSSVTNPMHIDRAMAIEVTTAPDPNTKLWILMQIINKRHDNRYVRQALQAVAVCEDPIVRARSALLAARLKDNAVLAKLLDDDEPAVRAAAALDAGLAGLDHPAPKQSETLDDADTKVACNEMIARAYIDPVKYGPELCAALSQSKDDALTDHLCHIMTILKTPQAQKTVRELLLARRGKSTPPTMAILAAGKLQVAEAQPDIRAILKSALTDPNIQRDLVHSAIVAADQLKLPVRTELYQLCKKYWNPSWRSELMFASATRALGRQLTLDVDQGPEAPTSKECQNLLIRAAYYVSPIPTTGPASAGKKTPLASAAAATAYWLLNPSSDPKIQIKQAASQPGNGVFEFTGNSATGARVAMDAAEASILAGDYIAWHIARSGHPEAFKLALQMLPAIDAPLELHVYNENLRGAGAMLLAFSAKTDAQKKIAIERIRGRLEPGESHTGEDDPILAGRYRCALLILGQSKELKTVRDQRNDGGHAVPAAFCALLFAGEIEALDYLLSNRHIPPRDVAAYLIYDGLDRVLADRAPSLPAIDASGPALIQLWQAEILRDYYVLHRDAIKLELKR
ncbi:MAG: hypothetical protein HN350_17510 [Phycisphaerales bacterium]|jgi:hypothetical protein|nr:hypothetical protein [Phycisphaerales bacterium]